MISEFDFLTFSADKSLSERAGSSPLINRNLNHE